MIPIGRINNPQAAQVFCDYLLSQKITADWIPEGAMFVIRVQGNQRLNEARAALQHFLRQPGDARYQNTPPSATQHQATKASVHDQRTVSINAGPMTTTLVVLSLMITAISALGTNESVTFHLWFHPSSIARGQIQRLIAPLFLHLNAIQLLFNMLLLWRLGGMLEKRLGSASLLFLVLLAGTLSNVAQFLVSGPFFGGMQGVVYALFGYLWLRGQRDVRFGVRLHFGIMVLMLLWLLLSWFGLLGVVVTAAQLSGLLLGLALGFVASGMPRGVNNV